MNTLLTVLQITAILFGYLLAFNATHFGNGLLMLVGSAICAIGITGLLSALGYLDD